MDSCDGVLPASTTYQFTKAILRSRKRAGGIRRRYAIANTTGYWVEWH
ncbi:MAG: hypothetical protein RMY64_06235 [Nostoc sp. DedQUE08]|nr:MULTISPECIES: hypothetical protein [unclassified Nostoc]MDZ8065227.1 hypothetical protein [Nostoc sp. DedQUE08]MDZ8095869.1 hypothetical protein [Nostoc sp. DedQUE05]